MLNLFSPAEFHFSATAARRWSFAAPQQWWSPDFKSLSFAAFLDALCGLWVLFYYPQ